jgi:hypothetical protein
MQDLIATYLPIAILVISILVFLVSVITEVTKKLPFLNKIPTDIEVFVLSIVLTVVAAFLVAGYKALPITWYFILAAIIAGFFVAFVAMYGWTKLYELWQRFQPPNKK